MTATNTWWEQAGTAFSLPFCSDCTQFHFYPSAACPFCGSDRIAPSAASGRGTVYSYSVVHRAPSPAFAADVPYVIAIVETEEGPHLMTRLVNVSLTQLTVGLPVQALSREAHPGALPVFTFSCESSTHKDC